MQLDDTYLTFWQNKVKTELRHSAAALERIDDPLIQKKVIETSHKVI